MKKKIMAILLIAVTVLSMTACGAGSSESKKEFDEPKEKEYVDVSEINNVFFDPDKYEGKYIQLTGKIFSGPDKDEDYVAYQAWHDIANSDKDFIFGLENDDSFAIDDYVSIDGVITGTFEGENIMGGTITCPMIHADTVEKLSYIDAVVPTISEIIPENAVAEQIGVSLKVDKIEFAEKETRIYLTETNSSSDKFSFSVYDIKIIQNGQQISQDSSSTSMYNGNYAELPYDILPNSSSSGVLVFPAIDSSASFQIYAEGYSDNWELEFAPFTIDISAQ